MCESVRVYTYDPQEPKHVKRNIRYFDGQPREWCIIFSPSAWWSSNSLDELEMVYIFVVVAGVDVFFSSFVFSCVAHFSCALYRTDASCCFYVCKKASNCYLFENGSRLFDGRRRRSNPKGIHFLNENSLAIYREQSPNNYTHCIAMNNKCY